MNFSKVINCAKLYDLYEQIFDYFNLTVYDLESCIDTNLSIEKIKNKLETFSDNPVSYTHLTLPTICSV